MGKKEVEGWELGGQTGGLSQKHSPPNFPFELSQLLAEDKQQTTTRDAKFDLGCFSNTIKKQHLLAESSSNLDLTFYDTALSLACENQTRLLLA